MRCRCSASPALGLPNTGDYQGSLELLLMMGNIGLSDEEWMAQVQALYVVPRENTLERHVILVSWFSLDTFSGFKWCLESRRTGEGGWNVAFRVHTPYESRIQYFKQHLRTVAQHLGSPQKRIAVNEKCRNGAPETDRTANGAAF